MRAWSPIVLLLIFGMIFAQNSCTDSDGVNYYTASKIVYSDSQVTDKPLADTCESATVLMERTCTGTSPSYIEYTCPSGCANGACVQNAEPVKTCEETDGGNNKMVKGKNTIYKDGQYYTSQSDYCKDSSTVTELTCNGGQWDVTYESCGSGYSCTDGACVQSAQVTSCGDYDAGTDYYTASKIVYSDSQVTDKPLADVCQSSSVLMERVCNGTSPSYVLYTCPSGCSNGACVQAAQVKSCGDYDAGKDYYTASKIIYTDSQVTDKPLADVCESSTVLMERICNGTSPSYVEFTCPSGYSCKDGACVQNAAPVSSCTDADGVNYYVASKIIYTDSQNTNKPLADVCESSTVLMERTCNGNSPSYVEYTCPSGYFCKDGACVQNAQIISCGDYDGTDYYTASKIIYTDSQVTDKPLADVCQSATVLMERICDGTSPSYVLYTCPSGCANGACIQPAQVTSCGDFDNTNYYVASKIIYTDSQVTDKPLADVCESSTVLMERICNGTSPSYVEFTCPSGYSCKDGACAPLPNANATTTSSNLTASSMLTYTVELKQGWNLISSPVAGTGYSKYEATISATSCGTSKVFAYDPKSKSYYTASYGVGVGDIVPVQNALWVKADSSCKITFSGYSKSDYAGGLTVDGGWLGFGSPYGSTSWNDLAGNCNAVSGPWEYNTASRQWQKATSINPGKGYFVKLASQCVLASSSVPPALPN